MMSFRNNRLADLAIPGGTVWLLTDIAEAKVAEELYARQSPQVLKALRDSAIVQSAESSNRIEGVTVASDRLKPLLLGNARPRDRSESELVGYRQALDRIHTRFERLEVTPQVACELHGLIHSESGDAGQFKRADNEIVQLQESGPPIVRFRPVPAARTLAAMEELCLSYRHTVNQGLSHPLLTAACLVLDFLCIHPFRDGNGRVSRLLTLLVLHRSGYSVGRYIGLERLVEESKEEYYDALANSSQGWHDGRHDLLPWLNYFLSVLRRAYMEFQQRAGSVTAPRGSKTDLILAALDRVGDEFTLVDIEQACPGVSRDWIRRVLRDLKEQGKVVCRGRGPGATWQKEGSNE